MILRIFLSLLVIGVLLYILACLYLYLIQEEKLFFPTKSVTGEYELLMNHPERERITIRTRDGITLDGWRQTATGKTFTILYFGGNAEDITPFLGKREFQNANIISLNYRSYGESEGRVSEETLFSDALEIYDALTSTLGVSRDTLFVMGRSLGTGVATYLASQRVVPGVILITPYDSIRSVGEREYPFFPVKYLLRHQFDSAYYASLRPNRVLILYGGRDTVIPNEHTKRLILSWNGEKEVHFFPLADHETIMKETGLNSLVENFLEKKN